MAGGALWLGSSSDLSTARAELAAARDDLDAASGDVTRLEAEVDAAGADLEETKADLEETNKDLAKTRQSLRVALVCIKGIGDLGEAGGVSQIVKIWARTYDECKKATREAEDTLPG